MVKNSGFKIVLLIIPNHFKYWLHFEKNPTYNIFLSDNSLIIWGFGAFRRLGVFNFNSEYPLYVKVCFEEIQYQLHFAT